MPLKSGNLTPQERVFSAAFASTEDKNYAGFAAGYSNPEVAAHKALARPRVLQEIARIQTERLHSELLPAAVEALHRILTNAKAPAGAQVQAAKLVFDRTLGAQDLEGKQPHEMTGEELARALDILRKQAETQARPVIDAEFSEIAQSPPDVFT